MNFLQLNPLTEAQLPAAVELDQLALGGLWTLDGYQRELESSNSDLLVLEKPTLEGLPADSQPPTALLGLACLWAILEEAHITILAVHPNYQRQGLGQVLLWALLRAAWLRGLEWATLEVRPSNQAAIALYQKFGFAEVGRRRRYYQDTGEDALIFWHYGLRHPEFRETLKIWQSQIGDRLCQSGWSLPIADESLYQPERSLDLGTSS